MKNSLRRGILSEFRLFLGTFWALPTNLLLPCVASARTAHFHVYAVRIGLIFHHPLAFKGHTGAFELCTTTRMASCDAH